MGIQAPGPHQWYDWKIKDFSCPAGRGFSGHADPDDPEVFRAMRPLMKESAIPATRMSQEVSKWVIAYLGFYTGYRLYWGYNLLTNLLPASWDIQVVSAAHTNRFFDASYLRISDPSTVSPQLDCCTTMLGFWYLITRIPANQPGFYRMSHTRCFFTAPFGCLPFNLLDVRWIIL